MDELVEKLRHLPKRQFTCQGGYLASPQALSKVDDLPFNPVLAVWTAATDAGESNSGAVLGGEDDLFGEVLALLGSFVSDCLDNRACPNRIQVSCPELAKYLQERLEDTGITVERLAQLPRVEAAVQELAAQLAKDAAGPSSLLDADGINLARVRSLADAAAEFYRAAPWRHLSELDVIEIESATAPAGMACVIVTGVVGATYGLHFFSSRADYDRFLLASTRGIGQDGPTGEMVRVEFTPFEDLPAADAELWTTHQLPVAGIRAYPSVLKKPAGAVEVVQPTMVQVAFAEAVLRALARTNEAQVDSGCWLQAVPAFDRQVDVTLKIPDLLELPSPEEWMRRGLAPDPRAHIYMPQYFTQHSMTTGDNRLEAIRAIDYLTVARTLNDPTTQPQSPEEQAQGLCFAAFGVHGRRCVQLARQALELDPNCTDAYVILAERATITDDKLELYRRGVESAEQQLGAAYFAENAGHFWERWETRPYMRARFGVAESLSTAGRADEAIRHYAELLRLNPADDLKTRFFLLPLLMSAGRDVEAAQLLKEFDDQSAHSAYLQALLAFRLAGVSPTADLMLRKAISLNSHVLGLLCSDARFPRPSRYTRGSFEEACFVVEQLRPVCEVTDGALDWFSAAWERREQEQVERQREAKRRERARQKKKRRR